MAAERQHKHPAPVVSLADRVRAREKAPAPPAAPAGAVRARVAAVTDTCWCCRQKVRAIVGVIVEPRHTADGSGFVPLAAVDRLLAGRLDPRQLQRRGIGELRHRESPGVTGGYIANGCIECDELIGRFHLEDLLTEHRMAGGSFGQLDIGIAVELDLEPATKHPGISALG